MTDATAIGHYRRMNGADGESAARWWRPPRFAGRLDILERRAAMLAELRRFFSGRGYVEVETPALQASPGLEPYMEAFETTLAPPAGPGRRMFLHTSPEFAMKKLLAAGMERIWQLARVFRNGEASWKHCPEFAMLEWYHANAGWREVAGEAGELVRALAGPHVSLAGASCDLSRPWRHLSVADAFAEHADIDLGRAVDDPLRPDPRPLRRAARAVGVRTAADDRWEDVFFRILLERVEPRLGLGEPAVLHSWPLPVAALARRDPDNPAVAERFEMFVCGVELANGYGELVDPAEHRRRAAAVERTRLRDGRPPWPPDHELLEALADGMPPSSGVALGFDRLVMLATRAERIEDVLWVPVTMP